VSHLRASIASILLCGRTVVDMANTSGSVGAAAGSAVGGSPRGAALVAGPAGRIIEVTVWRD
jgi:hypothetical protein